jgi:hypothetical protein
MVREWKMNYNGSDQMQIKCKKCGLINSSTDACAAHPYLYATSKSPTPILDNNFFNSSPFTEKYQLTNDKRNPNDVYWNNDAKIWDVDNEETDYIGECSDYLDTKNG